MGNGQKLKEILKDKGISIRPLAQKSNVPPTTLYSIVQRDTDVRYDIALKVSNVLNIPVSSICNKIPDTELSVHGEPLTISVDSPERSCFSRRALAIAKMLNQEDASILDRLITEFYVLDDESRNEIFKIMEMKHEKHDVAERVESIKTSL